MISTSVRTPLLVAALGAFVAIDVRAATVTLAGAVAPTSLVDAVRDRSRGWVSPAVRT